MTSKKPSLLINDGLGRLEAVTDDQLKSLATILMPARALRRARRGLAAFLVRLAACIAAVLVLELDPAIAGRVRAFEIALFVRHGPSVDIDACCRS